DVAAMRAFMLRALVPSLYNVPWVNNIFSNLSTLVLLPLEHLLIEVLFQTQVPISIGTETKEAHGVELGLFREHGTVYRKNQASPFGGQNQTDRGLTTLERDQVRRRKGSGPNSFRRIGGYWEEDWRKELNYACPPFDLVHRGLTHSRECEATVILILLAWVLALWWLMFLGVPKEVIELPPASGIIIPGPSGQREPCKNPAWKLLAARIV
ncbi:38377_t:CDS:2, partial [Gigaspora margarita]